MLTRRLFAACALCAATGPVASQAAAQTPGGIKRTVLQQTDGPTAGYVTILVRGELQPGGVVMRHTHPGIESAYIVEGGGTLSVQGLPDRALAAGDSFQVAAGTPHSLRNGDAVTRIAGTYVIEKGKPLSSPAPE